MVCNIIQSLFEFADFGRDGQDGQDGWDTHNLISKPHSVPTYTPYTTSLVVAGLKQHRNDQGFRSGADAVRFVARLRIGHDVTLRDVTYLHTQSNLRTSLRSYVYSIYYRTGRFRIKGVPQRPAVKDISRKSCCETYIFIHTCIHTYIHK